jgi:hypothetical protein
MKKAAWSDVVGLLHKADRTVPELCEITGMMNYTVRGYLHALAAEGVVEKGPRGNHKPAVWKWKHQPAPPKPGLRTWLDHARKALDHAEGWAQ